MLFANDADLARIRDEAVIAGDNETIRLVDQQWAKMAVKKESKNEKN